MTRPSMPLPLAVSMGDPAGIGPEICAAAWRSRANHTVPPFVVFGSLEAIDAALRSPGAAAAFPGRDRAARVATPAEALSVWANALPVIDVPLSVPARPGHPDSANGPAVIAAIDAAVEAVISNHCAALVTAPIAKHVLYAAGFRHPGHTEYLADLAARLTGGAPQRSVMMLACDQLRVVPLTIHVPLAAVPALITRELIIETGLILNEALHRDFGIARPRIAVAGLNPHAGEGGSMGREEIETIAPAIAALAERGLAVTGPHSADTLFHGEARARYDAAVTMYHDQGLIPIKTLAFDEGVNVTLGLPFIRTSPDHGTAFDIAGRGIARETSFLAALTMASRLAAARSGP